jgi:hypothetical protein
MSIRNILINENFAATVYLIFGQKQASLCFCNDSTWSSLRQEGLL